MNSIFPKPSLSSASESARRRHKDCILNGCDSGQAFSADDRRAKSRLKPTCGAQTSMRHRLQHFLWSLAGRNRNGPCVSLIHRCCALSVRPKLTSTNPFPLFIEYRQKTFPSPRSIRQTLHRRRFPALQRQPFRVVFVVALSRHEVGIDIEKVCDRVDYATIAEAYFTAEESKELREFPQKARQRKVFSNVDWQRSFIESLGLESRKDWR